MQLYKIASKFILAIIFLFWFTISVLAAGYCSNCQKSWTQPWAKDFINCPQCGSPLQAIESKDSDVSDHFEKIPINRTNKNFPNYYQRRVALCIGIDNNPSFPTLEFAASDARNVAGVLAGYGFDEVFLLTGKRATKRKILNERHVSV